MNDRILIQFQTPEQAEYFFNWFKEEGYDALLGSCVGDATKIPEFNCLHDELPGSISDPDCYYLEIE